MFMRRRLIAEQVAETGLKFGAYITTLIVQLLDYSAPYILFPRVLFPYSTKSETQPFSFHIA